MSEIQKISSSIKDWAELFSAHIYGQNLTLPSYISGLGKSCALFNEREPSDLVKNTMFNTSNSELTSVGYGIGRALCGGNSMLIVKQQDFLFLALDQLINTTCNLSSPQSIEGRLKIVSLVSDTGTEGTQAWSSNLSLFESLPPLVQSRYCYSADSFTYFLSNPVSPIEILFLSTRYTYKNPIFADILTPIENLSLVCDVGSTDYRYIYIVIGFVDPCVISDFLGKYCIYLMSSLNNPESIASLARFINSKPECERVTILEDTSSCLSVGRNIYYYLREIYEINLPINHIDLRVVSSSGFSLKDQLRQHDLT